MTENSSPGGAHEIEAVCEEYRTPIADGEGSAWVDCSVDLIPAAPDQPDRSLLYEWPVMEPAARSDSAPWHVHHYRCGPGWEGAYDIAVVNLRTWRDLVTWTAHLAGRPEAAGFAALIGAAAGPDAHELPAGLRPLPLTGAR